MRMNVVTNNTKLQELLDSDDELPIGFTEIPYIPAYQDDDRFEFIKDKRTKNPAHQTSSEVGVKFRPFQNHGKIMREGYLNRTDTFCFQCIEHTVNNKSLKWFFDYLMFRDLQSKYNFLISCLVPHLNNSIMFVSYYGKNHRYKVIVSR